MRSRPELTVTLRPGEPRPGATLDVEARLESRSETPVDRVVFTLTGVETVRQQRGRSSFERRHVHFALRAESPGKRLTPGTHRYSARFELPPRLPPPYSGTAASVEYVLEVRAVIPWWLDRVGRFGVPVRSAPVAAASAPCLIVTAKGGAKAGELYAELSLGSTIVEPGGEIAGTVALTNAAHARGLSVALVSYERLFAGAGSFLEPAIEARSEARRWEVVLSKGPPEEGAGVPFRMAVPPDVVPSYAGAISALEWWVEVFVHGLIVRRRLVRASVEIVPRAGARLPSPRGAVAVVGRERRNQSFAQVARRLGLEHDDDHGDVRGTFGAVTLRVDVEKLPDGKLATVAHLAWPSLGMGLDVASGHRLFARRVDVGVEAFDRRFHVRSRFPEQARALLGVEVCALLMDVDDAQVNDEGATLSVAVALADEGPLAAFVEQAVRTARALDLAFARVPLPAPLAAGAEAWRAMAARLGGRFEPGRGAVHEGELDGERVAITTRWAEDGTFEATDVGVPLDARVDPGALSSAARAEAASLGEQAGGRVNVGEETVTLTLDRPLPDPKVLDPALDGLVHLVHTVRRRGEAGPYRS